MFTVKISYKILPATLILRNFRPVTSKLIIFKKYIFKSIEIFSVNPTAFTWSKIKTYMKIVIHKCRLVLSCSRCIFYSSRKSL